MYIHIEKYIVMFFSVSLKTYKKITTYRYNEKE